MKFTAEHGFDDDEDDTMKTIVFSVMTVLLTVAIIFACRALPHPETNDSAKPVEGAMMKLVK